MLSYVPLENVLTADSYDNYGDMIDFISYNESYGLIEEQVMIKLSFIPPLHLYNIDDPYINEIVCKYLFEYCYNYLVSEDPKDLTFDYVALRENLDNIILDNRSRFNVINNLTKLVDINLRICNNMFERHINNGSLFGGWLVDPNKYDYATNNYDFMLIGYGAINEY